MNTKTMIGVLVAFVVVAGGFFYMNNNSGSSYGGGYGNNTDQSSKEAANQNVAISNGKTYNMTDIATHKDASSCWTAINGKVYDVTSWISKHPGGEKAILGICGIDGSAKFDRKHGSQARPNDELKNFYIGDLSN